MKMMAVRRGSRRRRRRGVEGSAHVRAALRDVDVTQDEATTQLNARNKNAQVSRPKRSNEINDNNKLTKGASPGRGPAREPDLSLGMRSVPYCNVHAGLSLKRFDLAMCHEWPTSASAASDE